MKTKKSTKLFIALAIAGLTSVVNAGAQTANMSPIVNMDDIYLKEFNEQKVLDGFKERGIPETEWQGALKWERYNFLMKKKGITPHITYAPPVKHMPVGCNNAGFEDTTFSAWTGATGICPAPVWTAGFISILNAAECNAGSRHTILTNSAGFDIHAISTVTGLPEIPYTAPGGGGVSVRLGNANTGAETEKLDYQIAVTPANTSFTYQYAVVLESPTGHTSTEQPRFDIRVMDSVGNIVGGICGIYAVEALGASGDTTFHPFNVAGCASSAGVYKRWTTVGISLAPYIGSTITLEFQTSDCTLTGHFGYAYIDASCSQLQAFSYFCLGDTSAQLAAPGGFAQYQWYHGSAAIAGATSSTYTVIGPIIGDVYTVQMTSVSGCGTSLSVILAYSQMTTSDNTIPISCHGLTDGSSQTFPVGAAPPFTYSWVSASGGPVISTSDAITNVGPGTYYVHISTNGGCFVNDTVIVADQPDDNDTILEVTTLFCPNDVNITLNAPGGLTNYQWYDASGNLISGATSSTLVIPAPLVGDVYIVGFDPGTSQCRKSQADTLAYSILTGLAVVDNNVSCYGLNDGQASASATSLVGPYTYEWVNSSGTTVSTTSTLSSAYAGTYTVTVSTLGGCEYLDTLSITQPFNPGDSIHLYPSFCVEDDSLYLDLPSIPATNFTWYSGDSTGIIVQGPDTTSSYWVVPPIVGNQYTVAVSTVGACTYLITATLQYSPPPDLPDYFVTANVFTPDGNTKNDKFNIDINPATAQRFEYAKDFHVEIFNRWGRKVFTSDNIENQWDGKINGAPADEGVYYWIASFTSLCTPGGEAHISKGFVQIFRKP